MAKIYNKPSTYLSNLILDNPYLFNMIRTLLAGNQHNTKQFVYNNLLTYNCKTIIDIGCGTGDFAEACPTSASYLGLDLNGRYIDVAKKRFKEHKNKKFIQEDILKMTSHEKYDAVLLISMMHHFSDEDFITVLNIVRKITKKIIIIADIIPDPPYLIQRISASLDRGRFVRPKQEKLQLLKHHVTVAHTEILKSRIAVQYGIICEV